MEENARRMSEDIELVDALTDFLYDECDMGGASTFNTKRALDFIEDWKRPRAEG